VNPRSLALASLLAVRLALLLAACGGDAAERTRTFGGDRAALLQIPAMLDEDRAYPLVVALHGYSITGYIQQAYFGLRMLTDTSRAFVVAPTGYYDSQGKPYWNADEGCCDHERAGPDDVGFLATLIDDIAGEWPIDREAVFAIGQANGGNMAYRLACDRADAVTAIVAVAAGAGIDPAACAPARPVSVLHVHGTADLEFAYEGGGPFQMAPGAPGAVESVTRWAGHDGCATARTPDAAFELDAVVAGAETRPERFGCAPPIAVELWTMEGSDHLPSFVDTFVPAIWPWLEARRGPR
jgi:polyhydroxybutyrate depolymerase